MRHDHRGGPRLAQSRRQLGDEGFPGRGIEGGERLVQQEQLRLDGEGPRQARPLRLAPVEGARVPRGEVPDAEPRQPLPGPSLGLSPAVAVLDGAMLG